MLNSKIVKKAHEITKKIRREYADVDYKTQFGLCLSYLLENKGEVEMENYKVYDYEKFSIIAKYENSDVNYSVILNNQVLEAKLKYGKLKGESVTILDTSKANIMIKSKEVNRTEIFNFRNELTNKLANNFSIKDVKTRKFQGRVIREVELEREFKGLESDVASIVISNHVNSKESEQNDVPTGYFRCWECGSIESLSKMKLDGTCGC